MNLLKWEVLVSKGLGSRLIGYKDYIRNKLFSLIRKLFNCKMWGKLLRLGIISMRKILLRKLGNIQIKRY